MLSARISLILSAGCMLSLCGCLGKPDSMPQASEIAPAALGLGTELAPAAGAAWWKSFNDPQADRLAGLMLQGSPTLLAAIARIEAAQAELTIAQSQRYPQVNLDGQVVYTLLSNDYLLPAPYGGSWRWIGDIQSKMTWSLDFWGKQAALINRAQNLAQARVLDLQAAGMALAGSFAQFYIGLQTAYQNLDIARQAVTERQTILDLTQSLAASGIENEAALEQAKALRAAADVDVMLCESDRDLAIHALVTLTGQGANAYDQITRPASPLDAALVLPATIPADLLARRPDILAAHARISAALASREAAGTDFYPNIDLRADLGVQAVSLSSLFSGSALTTGIGPAIHLPIFDAGKIRAQYAAATADLNLAVADYNGTVLTAIRQTADALTQIKSLAGQRSRQQNVLDSAARAMVLAEERYRLGVSDQLTVLTAESLLLQARRQMAALNAQLATQRVTLLLSVGGGIDPPISDMGTGREGSHDR